MPAWIRTQARNEMAQTTEVLERKLEYQLSKCFMEDAKIRESMKAARLSFIYSSSFLQPLLNFLIILFYVCCVLLCWSSQPACFSYFNFILFLSLSRFMILLSQEKSLISESAFMFNRVEWRGRMRESACVRVYVCVRVLRGGSKERVSLRRQGRCNQGENELEASATTKDGTKSSGWTHLWTLFASKAATFYDFKWKKRRHQIELKLTEGEKGPILKHCNKSNWLKID